jgi:hypothetical protein
MDAPWFRDQLRLPKAKDAVLITASTPELRQLVDEYGVDPRAFQQTERMKRLR